MATSADGDSVDNDRHCGRHRFDRCEERGGGAAEGGGRVRGSSDFHEASLPSSRLSSPVSTRM